jgi:hypothetical protein
MDPHVFDDLTRQLSAPRSRRTAWRALLAGAVLGATTKVTVASPSDTGENRPCGRDQERCPGRCFANNCVPVDELCCTGPEWIICGNTCCQAMEGDRKIEHPCSSGDCIPPASSCEPFIAGSYRRR